MKKKFLSLALALVMLLSLVACGGNNNAPADTTPDTPPADTTEPADTTPDEPGETVVNYKDMTHDDMEIFESILGEFTDLYEDALAETNQSMRFAKMAVAEAKMLEAGIMVPTTSKGGSRAIGRVAPYGVTPCLWGNDSYRWYKYRIVDSYTDADGNTTSPASCWTSTASP